MDRPTIQQQIVAVDAAYRAARDELARMEQDPDIGREDRDDQLTRVQQLRAARETLRDEAFRRATHIKVLDAVIGSLASLRQVDARQFGAAPASEPLSGDDA